MSSVSDWGTTPIRALIRGPSAAGSMPRTRSVPPVAGDTHPIIRIVELLPAPFGPRNPNASPRWIAKSMPSTATKPPNRFVSAWASINGPVTPADASEQAPGSPRGFGSLGLTTQEAAAGDADVGGTAHAELDVEVGFAVRRGPGGGGARPRGVELQLVAGRPAPQ